MHNRQAQSQPPNVAPALNCCYSCPVLLQLSGAATALLPLNHSSLFAWLQEVLLQQQQVQLDDLAERLAAAVGECGRLTSEREELQYQIRRLHDVLMAKTGGWRGRVAH